MKNTRKLLLLMLMIGALVFAACSADTEEPATSDDANNSEDTGSDSAENASEGNVLDFNLSDEELYEKAKEEGKVVIYAKGSKFKDVKTTFEEEYPGITVEPYKIDRIEIREKLTREHEAGVFNVDVVHTNAEPDLVAGGYIHPFKPEDIMEKFADGYQDSEYPVHYLTVNPIIYNTEVYDEPPISNWWDLTEPEWKGKVLMNDPVSNATYSEMLVTIIQNADEMAEAYKEKYGEEIELTEENAGWEFIARFIENDPILMSSGEDIIESVGQPGQSDPPIGFSSSSKLRHIEQTGLPIDGIFDIKPRVSVMSSSVLYIANNAPHPHAAMLLARYTMGGTDGKAAGLEPFNLYGAWVPRTDTDNPNPFPVDDIVAWELDQEFYDQTFPEFRNFWISKIE